MGKQYAKETEVIGEFGEFMRYLKHGFGELGMNPSQYLTAIWYLVEDGLLRSPEEGRAILSDLKPRFDAYFNSLKRSK